jgi:hypothetical protein
VVTIGHRTYTNPTTDFPRRRRYAGTLDAKFLGQDAQRFSYLWSERPAAVVTLFVYSSSKQLRRMVSAAKTEMASDLL